MEYKTLIETLFTHADIRYRDFSIRIVNTKTPVIGVRSPILAALEKKLLKAGEVIDHPVWHSYLEADAVIATLALAKMNDENARYDYLEAFLAGADNWATVDTLAGNCGVKTFPVLLKRAQTMAQSPHPFVRRFAYVAFLPWIFPKEGLPDIFALIHPDAHYYVRMAQAWLLSYCYLADPGVTRHYLETALAIDDWTVNKTISKIRDSFRVDDAAKESLIACRRPTRHKV